MKKKEQTKGVTILSLVVTVIVLLILASITIYSSMDIIERAKLEELKTNMLLIKAKAKGCVEDATFKMGINPDENKKTEVRAEVYEGKAKLEKASNVPDNFEISDTTTCYWLTEEAQNDWGLNQMELRNEERYLIRFDEENADVEIYSTEGYEGKYRLTDIQEAK